MNETKQAIERFLILLSTEKMEVETLPLRLEQQRVSHQDRQYLGLVLGRLNKLFGTAVALNTKTRTTPLLSQTACAIFDSYESTLSADALAEKCQPLMDSALLGISVAEKERLLARVDAISQVLDDNMAVARLALIWSYIEAVPIPSASELAKGAPLPPQLQKQVLRLLTGYRTHLYGELRQAWPYRLGIATNPSGQVWLLNRQGIVVNEKKLSKNLRLLKQKCQVTNEAIRLLQSKALSLPRFRHHFNQTVRPVISQERTTIDNQFLQDMMRCLMKPLRVISSFFLPKGAQIASNIERLLSPLSTTNPRRLSHVN